MSIDRGKGKHVTKKILVSLGIHVDAVAGWLGSYGGEDSPDDISRGMFAGEVGSMRLLKLFERENLKTSWFIPGHSIETFPEQMKAVAAAGHEIGLHGYLQALSSFAANHSFGLAEPGTKRNDKRTLSSGFHESISA